MDNETETDIDTDFIEFNGDRWEGLFTTKEGKGVLVHTAGHRKEWIVFDDYDDAEEACKAYFRSMRQNDPEEFKCLVGADRILGWGMGQGSFEGFLDELDPAEHFASYNGNEINNIEVGADFEEEIGFRPAVAYCRSF